MKKRLGNTNIILKPESETGCGILKCIRQLFQSEKKGTVYDESYPADLCLLQNQQYEALNTNMTKRMIDPKILKQNIDSLYDLTFISPESKNISFIYDVEKRDLFVEYIGYKGTDYHAGQYFIHVNLPTDYPESPPKIRILTESGRFYPGCYLSLSISHYHKESWVPTTLEFLVVNIISAFTDDLHGIGHIITTSEERKHFAQESRHYNETHYPELSAKFNLTAKEKHIISQLSKDDRVGYVKNLNDHKKFSLF